MHVSYIPMPLLSALHPSRRALLRTAAGLAAAAAWPLRAQPLRPATTGRPLRVTQIYDASAAQQDVSKDILVGARAAWQELNAHGGVRGRPIQHTALPVDGSDESLRAALAQVRDDPNCVVLSGTAGDRVATALMPLLREEKVALAHAAPWLQNSSVQIDDQTFPIFAARQEQVAHAMQSLSSMGMREVGAVYATAMERELYHSDLLRIAETLHLNLQTFGGGDDLLELGLSLSPNTPAVLLFVGGTPELVRFTQGLEKKRQRYVVALADVNLQTMMQMGAARHTPVIATQPVPVVTAALPIVRAYRDTLARLFDEPPSPLSLAGFVAARYTAKVLAEAEGPLTRASVLAAFQRRAPMDLDGYRIAFDSQRRSATFVTQSMLTADGRVIG